MCKLPLECVSIHGGIIPYIESMVMFTCFFLVCMHVQCTWNSIIQWTAACRRALQTALVQNQTKTVNSRKNNNISNILFINVCINHPKKKRKKTVDKKIKKKKMKKKRTHQSNTTIYIKSSGSNDNSYKFTCEKTS